jgi:hypothetical protein
MSWRVILLVHSLISPSFLSAGFCGEEPIVTGPKADPLFRDEGEFRSQHIAIGNILEYPEDYDQRTVVLKGTVTKLNHPPWAYHGNVPRLRMCHGNLSIPFYTFDLQDDTGSLEIGVFASPSCWLNEPLYPVKTAVTEGDRIIAQVRIAMSNMDPATGQNRRTVGAVFGMGKRITE